MLFASHIKGLLAGLVLYGVLCASARADYGWGDSSVFGLDLSTTWYDSSGSGDSNTFALDLSTTWYPTRGWGDSGGFALDTLGVRRAWGVSNTFEIAEFVCGEDADCDDLDACTWDQCISSVCVFTPDDYGNVNHDPIINVFDILCQLAVVEGVEPLPPSCDPADPPDADITSMQGDCVPNETVNVFDMFAVLDAIAGVDPCCSPQLTGACCTEGVCTDGVTHANCHYGGGIYMGDGTDCGSVTCP